MVEKMSYKIEIAKIEDHFKWSSIFIYYKKMTNLKIKLFWTVY